MLSWIIEGVEYALDDGGVCYLLGMDGMGMMPVNRIEESGPLQNGSTDRGYRLGPRMIALALEVFGDTQVELWQKRLALISLFKPGDTPGILKWKLGTVTRQIEAYFVDGLGFSSRDRSGWSQKTALSLRANDPAWYDPAAKAANVTVSPGSAGAGEIPMDVPTEIGASGVNETLLISYQGTIESFPFLIRITGPIADPIITHLNSGEKLDFSSKTIAVGDHYDIDLRYGYKTVKNAAGANKNAELSADSDLTTFRIMANPDAPNGTNQIKVTGSGETAATRVDITYYDRFLGI